MPEKVISSQAINNDAGNRFEGQGFVALANTFGITTFELTRFHFSFPITLLSTKFRSRKQCFISYYVILGTLSCGSVSLGRRNCAAFIFI